MKTTSRFSIRKTGLWWTLVLLVTFSFQGNLWVAAPTAGEEAALKKMTANFHWLGHDSFRIDGRR